MEFWWWIVADGVAETQRNRALVKTCGSIVAEEAMG